MSGDTGSARWDGRLGPKQWGPIVGVLGVAVVVLAVLFGLGVGGDDSNAASNNPVAQNKVTHEHADFAIFIRGQQFNFHDPQFVSETGHEEDLYVHIHDPRYTVVHVHKDGITWDYFLNTLHFKLDDPTFRGVTADRTCLTIPSGEKLCQSATETFKFYVNGVKVDGVSNTGIHDLDRVLISFGSETAADVVAQQLPKVTDEACIPSERCDDRIPVNEPPEECTESNNTCAKPGG